MCNFFINLFIGLLSSALVLVGDHIYIYRKNKKENLIKLKNAFSSLKIKISFFVKDMTEKTKDGEEVAFKLCDDTIKRYDEILPYIFQIKSILSENKILDEDLSKKIAKYTDDLLRLLEEIRNTKIYNKEIAIKRIEDLFNMDMINEISRDLNMDNRLFCDN